MHHGAHGRVNRIDQPPCFIILQIAQLGGFHVAEWLDPSPSLIALGLAVHEGFVQRRFQHSENAVGSRFATPDGIKGFRRYADILLGPFGRAQPRWSRCQIIQPIADVARGQRCNFPIPQHGDDEIATATEGVQRILALKGFQIVRHGISDCERPRLASAIAVHRQKPFPRLGLRLPIVEDQFAIGIANIIGFPQPVFDIVG